MLPRRTANRVCIERPVRRTMTDRRRQPSSSEARWLVVGPVCLRGRRSSLVLVALGVANIAMRARWHEVEDGVLLGRARRGRDARSRSRRVGRRRAPASAGRRAARGQRRAGRDAGRRRRVSASQRTKARGSSYTLLRLGIAAGARRHARAGAARRLDVLRARRRRPLHAAGRRVGAAAAAARSGDAAFLLAVRRVLRRRSRSRSTAVRSARLDVLLGRRGRDGAAAAAAAALHAGVPRAAAVARAPLPTRCCCRVDVPAGARARRRRAIVVDRARRVGRRRCSRARSSCSIAREPVYLFVCAVAAAASCWRARSARSRR